MELDTLCCVCGCLLEVGGHLFLRCKEVKKVWRTTQLEGVRQELLLCQSQLEILERIFCTTGKHQASGHMPIVEVVD